MIPLYIFVVCKRLIIYIILLFFCQEKSTKFFDRIQINKNYERIRNPQEKLAIHYLIVYNKNYILINQKGRYIMELKVFIHNLSGHLKTINAHKLMVMRHCFQVGLYKQGLLHDLSKYSPSEFIPGVKYYQGNRSPNNAQREAEGCSTAWLHHKGRNRHHYEYWIDYTNDKDAVISGMKMPVHYVIEMFCDRVAASKIYNKESYTDADSLDYFMKGKGKYIMHPQTEKLLLKLLIMLKEKGEAYTFRYIRTRILSDNGNCSKNYLKKNKNYRRKIK